METEGRRIHGQAEEAREKGEFVKALEFTDQATTLYQRSGDPLGMAEVHSSRFLTLGHLYEQTQDINYLILAKHAAMASVEIAKESGNQNALALPLFNLAKAQETLGELKNAVTTYREGITTMQDTLPELHNRPSVVADMQVHLATCEYNAGDKPALNRAESALSGLEAANEPSKYNNGVWLSGGHMRISQMLHTDNPQKAREHLENAKTIIDANPELKLRQKQWEKLAQTFT